MHEPLTAEELQKIEDFRTRQKEDIEAIIGDNACENYEADKDKIVARAMRGYLVGLLEETVGWSHEELYDCASAFADGWIHCMNFGERA